MDKNKIMGLSQSEVKDRQKQGQVNDFQAQLVRVPGRL